ncbi:MAG TPA: thioesterase family protein [Thermoanaerobaculia bacterium]
MSHRFPLDLRFGDFDSAGIVYYPRYLHFCHGGMEEYFRDVVGIDYATLVLEHRLGLPTVRTEVEHRRPIHYGERVELEVEVTRVGSTSVEWRDRFWHAGVEHPATEARIVTVLVDMDDFTKRPVPDWLRERLGGGAR